MATISNESDYMRWLSHQRGLARFNEPMELQNSGYRGRGLPAIVLGATFGRKLGRNEYEEGAYSIPMPGANQSGLVTMETLDDDGNVICSQKLATKNGKLPVDTKAVRKAAGPIARPKRAGKAKAAPVAAATPAEELAPEASPAIPAGEYEGAAPVAPEIAVYGSPDAIEAPSAPDMPADAFKALMARLDAVERRLAGMDAPGEPVTVADELPASNDGAEIKRSDRPRRLRLVRRYLAMRAQRDLDRRALIAGGDHCRALEGERDAARDDVAHYREIALRNGRGWQEAKATLDRTEETLRDMLAMRRAAVALAWKYRKEARHAGSVAAIRLRDIRAAESERLAANERANALAGELDKIRAERDAARATPVYFNTEGQERRDAIGMASNRARDALAKAEAAERQLATERGKAAAALSRVDALAERALRAENALRALQARIDRAPAPYVMQAPAVSWAA